MGIKCKGGVIPRCMLSRATDKRWATGTSDSKKNRSKFMYLQASAFHLEESRGEAGTNLQFQVEILGIFYVVKIVTFAIN